MKITILLFLLIAGFSSQAQVTDVDGNAYKTVSIGTQTWMAENLNVSRFRNGDTIPEARTMEDWKKAGEEGKPAWCYYDNAPENGKKYGKLYNWYAVNDSRGLAPVGWSVPSDSSWTILIDYLGGESVSGEKMKSTQGWRSGNGTNESGFSAYSGGFRNFSYEFGAIGWRGGWWTSTEYFKHTAWYRFLHDYNDEVYRENENKGLLGLSIRCIKD
jgi:uncharacterized protein (TIGR02145 family)